MNTTPLKKIYQYASTGVDVGNAHHYWWCGNPASPGQVIDTIVYRADGPDKQGVSAIALSPEPGEVHACDPSIIKGIFVFDESDYQFALFYTLLTEVGKPNELAWAVSNNLNGPWEKVGTLITVLEGWGAGQPSVTAVSGGKILLFYTYGSHQETTMRRAYVDLTDALRPNIIEDVGLTEEGLPYPLRGGAVIYDWRDRSFVLAYNGAQYPGHPPVSENVVVAKIPEKGVWSGQGSWDIIRTITAEDVGAYRVFGPGWLRNVWGGVTSNTQLLISTSTKGENWLWSYQSDAFSGLDELL